MENKKTAIVTGGGQGIGRCVAAALLDNGFNVVIADIDREAGREAVSALRGSGAIIFVPCDVADEKSVRNMTKTAIKRFGRLDLLVNNAAISVGGRMESLSIKDWNRVIGVNLTGPFLCSKFAAQYLKRNRGLIINIASTRVFMSEPGTEAYSASKGGIYTLTHSMALSLAPRMRVNCISPGWIHTAEWAKGKNKGGANHLTERDHLQHPAGRVGRPEDIAALVIFLSKQENSFITGANFVVDGGMTRKMIYE